MSLAENVKAFRNSSAKLSRLFSESFSRFALTESSAWDDTYRCEILCSDCGGVLSISLKSFEDGKKSRIPEQGSIFLNLFAKSIFSLIAVSSLCFDGLGSNESIHQSSQGVTFLFFFLTVVGNFHF